VSRVDANTPMHHVVWPRFHGSPWSGVQEICKGPVAGRNRLKSALLRKLKSCRLPRRMEPRRGLARYMDATRICIHGLCIPGI